MQLLDLAKLARSRCDVFSNLAGRKGIKLTCLANNQSASSIHADSDRLSQVIDNLLDNAIRHSPENSIITLVIQQKDAGLECSITDQGTGIPAEHLPFIFERFYRVDASRSRSRNRTEGGTGLGLAIAKALVSAQGGHIHAESIDGQGTTIKFWLPIV
jgi:two-component system sensor histidine kinase ResE